MAVRTRAKMHHGESPWHTEKEDKKKKTDTTYEYAVIGRVLPGSKQTSDDVFVCAETQWRMSVLSL